MQRHNNNLSFDNNNNDYRYQQQKTTLTSSNNNYNQFIPSTVRETDSLDEDSIIQNNNIYNDDDSVNTATNMRLQQQFSRNNQPQYSSSFGQKYQQFPDITIQDEDQYHINEQQQVITTPMPMQLQPTHSGSNGNNYDFLIDEEYQQVKALQGELTNAKWLIMGEKVSLNMILKDIVADLMHQDDILSQKSQSIQSISGTANSSLKTAAQLSSLATTGNTNNIFQNKQNYKNPRYMNMKELDYNLKQILVNNNSKIIKLLQKSDKFKNQLFQEQEKCQYLESQLNQRLIRQQSLEKQNIETQNQNSTEQQEREQYISELELQLQETRRFLLDKNLKVSDQQEEINSLKKQLQNTDQNFKQLEEQKREIDELVIKVSQELRNKESDLRDFNYSLVNERDHLLRQVDILKKEVQEEKNKNQTLETLEQDLLYKYEQSQNDITQQKSYILELQEKISVNSEAIEKAQKVIQRLNEELEKSSSIMKKIEQERDQSRAECKDLGKRIIDLNKQLQNTQAQHQMTQQQVSIQLKQEIDELKEALRQYQQQFDDERRNLNLNLREANDEKYKLHIDKEKIEITLTREIALLKQQIEENMKQSQKQIQHMESEHKEIIESMEIQNKNKEDQAQSQIKYLQKRLREVQTDYLNNQRQGNCNINQQPTGKISYLQVIKQEFEKLSNELQENRQIIKSQSHDLVNVSLPSKLQQFEEFKLKVLSQLSDFEIKAEGLANLSKRYEKELDDQKKLFTQMKQMLKDKDFLIANIQKQVKIREQQRELYVNTIKKELDRQTHIIQSDLIQSFQSTQQAANQVNYENQEQERRFQSFKYEYIQVLEDRDRTNNQNLLLKGQVEVLNRDLDRITSQHFDFADKIRVIVNKSQGIKEDQQIIIDVESVVDELRIRNEEITSYKQQLDQLTSQQEEDKKFMQNRVKQVEEQLYQIQKSNMQKEEEMQQSHLQKETKLINDIQKLQSEYNGVLSQLQTRERQVKKLQEQKNHQQDEITELLQKLDSISQEKQNIQQECEKTIELIQQVQVSLDQTQQQLEQKQQTILELENDKQKIEDRNQQFKEQCYQKDLELQRERELNLQLQDEKYQAVNNQDAAIEKQQVLERENSNIYQELVIQKETVKEVSQAFEETEREKFELQRTCEQMNEVVAQVQDEIIQSQRAIESLNHALEKMRRKYNKARELKHQIKQLKQHDHHQNELIEAMRRQLNKPKQTQEIQTDQSGMQQIAFLSEESQILQQRLIIIQRENEQLQESLQRQSLDINRLIDEKRDLEDLVDQQNQAIKQIRMNNQQQQNNSLIMSPNQNVKENHNSMNTAQKYNQHDNDLLTKILQEKENYIMRLEQELSDMRRELDICKEKLISYEIGNLSMDRSLGGGGGQMRSYNPTHAKNSIIANIANQTANPIIMKTQGVKSAMNNNLSLTNNSLHFSNMYNATQITSNPMGLNNNNISGGNNNHQFSTLQNPQMDYAYKSLNKSSIL